MNPQHRPLLKEVLPGLVAELTTLLEQRGEMALAVEVQNFAIFEHINHRHGSDIYTAQRPNGPWGPHHRTLSLRSGALHIDIVGSRIVFVEVLRKPTSSVQKS